MYRVPEHSRGELIKDFLNNLKKKKEVVRKATYKDKGEGTHMDGYSLEELQKLVDHWMTDFQAAGTALFGLRNRACFLLPHAVMGPGETVRYWQLSDLWSDISTEEGTGRCMMLGVTDRQGKTIVNGRSKVH